jgi:hypothetical protein
VKYVTCNCYCVDFTLLFEIFVKESCILSMVVVGGMVELGVGSLWESGGGVSLFGEVLLSLNFLPGESAFSLSLLHFVIKK